MSKSPLKRVTINFDLLGDVLKEHLNKDVYEKAYYNIRCFLEKNEFEHTQESSYTSKEPMSIYKTKKLIKEMTNKYSYLKGGIDSMFITTIDKVYDVTSIVKDAKLTTFTNDEDLYKEMETKYSLNIEEEDTSSKKIQIRFDINHEVAKDCLVSKNYEPNPRTIYKKVERFLNVKLEYEKKQRSVFISNTNKTTSEVIKDVIAISKKLGDFTQCFKSFQISVVGRSYDITKLANRESKTFVVDKELENKEKENETSIGFEL